MLSDWCTDARKGKENFRGGAALDADQQAIHIRLKSMVLTHPNFHLIYLFFNLQLIFDPLTYSTISNKNFILTFISA